ncbi:MAG TPA: pseudouridine synthase [Thermoanaerobaculia bacterium]|nr:pseudouridine synthase [Thermoanaerobaculia bacterium]
MSLDRLQKIIARAGLASRREAEEMILDGRVRVNGKVITELGTRADSLRDHIKVDGKLLRPAEEPRYILLYKPKEVMTTSDDPEGRRTVLHYLKGVRERVFPVGRLDYQSEGLLLLTNDGELAHQLSHPSHGTVKTYHVKVRGVPTDRVVEKLERGITLDGVRTRPAEIERIRTTGRSQAEGNSWFEVRLREGRTQQIRKMFKAVGHPVSKLKRVAIGAIRDNALVPGQWRDLDPREVRLLSRNEEPETRRPRRQTARAREIKPKTKATRKAPAKKAAATKKPPAVRRKAAAKAQAARSRAGRTK